MSKLSELCAEKGVTLTAEYLGSKPREDKLDPLWLLPMMQWRVTLEYEGRKHTLEYSTGIGHAKNPPSGFMGIYGNWRDDRSLDGVAARQRWLKDKRCAKTPAVADVVYCLCSDARAGELDFDDFCSEFGYDSDSRKAERIWQACKDACIKARVLFGADFDDFANAEH